VCTRLNVQTYRPRPVLPGRKRSAERFPNRIRSAHLLYQRARFVIRVRPGTLFMVKMNSFFEYGRSTSSNIKR